jgi:hypothetical protein
MEVKVKLEVAGSFGQQQSQQVEQARVERDTNAISITPILTANRIHDSNGAQKLLNGSQFSSDKDVCTDPKIIEEISQGDKIMFFEKGTKIIGRRCCFHICSLGSFSWGYKEGSVLRIGWPWNAH